MDKKTTNHMVLAIRGGVPGFRPISAPVPRPRAVLMVRDEWAGGAMARLHPPLGRTAPEPDDPVQGTA